MSDLLQLKNVSKIYTGGLFRSQETVALKDSWLSITDETPAILAVAGESGSGKTTMGLLLLGFINPSVGQVLYKGEDLWQAKKSVWRDFRKEVQAIFQDPFEFFNPFYRIDHVMIEPLKKFGFARTKRQQRERMEKALTQVGLRPVEILGRYPHQLSGGQRQRITVARALMLEPKVIVADEPVSMVDASLRATILKSLRSLRDDLGISILYITHDLTTAYHISDNILILYQGAVVEAGDVNSVITDPQHPYTQLLVGSIAWPNPKRKWEKAEQVGQARMQRVAQGCPFAPRCQHAMEICTLEHPPMYQTNGTRAVSCFLYQDAAQLERDQIQKVLVAE